MPDVEMRRPATVDIASEVPLLVGVVGSPEDAGTASSALGEAFAGILAELRGRCPRTPLVLLCALTSDAESAAIRAASEQGIPAIACLRAPHSASEKMLAQVAETRVVDGDPRHRIAYVSDLLVVVSSGSAPAELLALADRRRNGEPPAAGLRNLLAPPDVGPCFVLEGASLQRFFPPRFAGDKRGERDFTSGLERRSRFNIDLQSVTEPKEGNALERLRTRTATVTNSLQRNAHTWQRVLYVLAFIAATVQVIQIQNALFIRVGAIALAFVVYFFVRRQDYQNRYQDYRAISEALRVQIVWSSIGVADGVEESYLPMQQTDLQWIRNLLRVVHFFDRHETSVYGTDVVLNWVTGQHTYFNDHSQLEARHRDRFGAAALGLGAVSLLASLVALGFAVVGVNGPKEWLGVGVLAAWTAVCVAIARSYSRTRAYSENANRYQRMFFVFDTALTLLKKAHGREAEVRTIASELGRDALAENAEWLLYQRERPISVVQTDAS